MREEYRITRSVKDTTVGTQEWSLTGIRAPGTIVPVWWNIPEINQAEGETVEKRAAGAITILAFFGILCAILACYLAMQYFTLLLRATHAEEQVAIFVDMRNKALETDPREAVGYLEYAVNYYPSGTKQIPGTHLDSIVEQIRAEMIQRMIDDLREKTGSDLGEDPKEWISRYGTK